MLNRLLILLSVISLLASCGDENSRDSAIQPDYGEFSSSVEMVSSSSSADASSSEAMSSSSENPSSSEALSSSEKSSSSGKSSSSFSSSSALKSIYDAGNNTLTDLRDGQVYKTVTIGTQVWMAENLNYLPKDTVGTYFAGRSVCGGGEYESLQEGDCSVYGRLYEISIVNRPAYRNMMCPDGWDVPTTVQYQRLVSFLESDVVNKLKTNEAGFWSQIDSNTNKSGFSAKPSGHYNIHCGFDCSEKEKIPNAAFAKNTESTVRNAFHIYNEDSYSIDAGFGQGFFIAFRCIKK